MSSAGDAASHALTLLTRPECGLCDEMQRAIDTMRTRHTLPPLELLDVDSDRELQRRWGLKIPVLLLDGELVCSVRLDADALLRALGDRRGAA